MKRLNLWQKEWLEAVRSYKILFIPLTFLLLGISQPIALHFLPQMISQSGMPEGARIEIPIPPAGSIVAMAFDQFNQMGVFVLVLAIMGLISRESELGLTGLVFTLGISKTRYVMTKWSVVSGIVFGAGLLGVAGAAYYTDALGFGAVSWSKAMAAALFYSVYDVFIVSLALLTSALFHNQLAAGATALGGSVLLSLIAYRLPKGVLLLPTQAGKVAQAVLQSATPGNWWAVVVASGVWIALILLATRAVLERKEY